MRIRSILPRFWESEDVGSMDWETRLLFVGLWSYVDDNGVGRDVTALIAADLFAMDLAREDGANARETLARVSRGLQTLSDGGQIVRYRGDHGPLLFVTQWDRYQKVDRPAKERYPRPTRDDAVIRETVATLSRDSRETLAPGEGEKGRRGEEKYIVDSLTLVDPASPKPTRYPASFERWWSHYPSKTGKAAAAKAWRTASKKLGIDDLVAAADRYATSDQVQRGYVCNPATWLNQERWLDEAPQPAAVAVSAYRYASEVLDD